MKRVITIAAALLMTASIWAQAPQKMSYQAVVRDNNNSLVANQTVGMQISILQGGATGTAVYVETQTQSSNDNGLVSLEIGTGAVVSGDFTTIDWGNDTYFIKTETDLTGGTTYTITGTSQLLSVPYALHAKTAENVENINIPGNNTISIPAFAMSKSLSTTVISEARDGLLWKQNYAANATFSIKKPANYMGGDVEFSIFFKTTTSTSGVVDFFIRPNSYNHAEGLIDPGAINSSGVSVSGSLGFATVYEQKFTIPANRLTKDWWNISIQNQGNNSTYTDDVVVMTTALTY